MRFNFLREIVLQTINGTATSVNLNNFNSCAFSFVPFNTFILFFSLRQVIMWNMRWVCLLCGDGLKRELCDGDCSSLYSELGFKPWDNGSFLGFEWGSLTQNTNYWAMLTFPWPSAGIRSLYFHFSKRFQSKSSKPSLEYFPASWLAAESPVNLTSSSSLTYP